MELPKSYVYDQLGNMPRGNLYYLKYDVDKIIYKLTDDYQELLKEKAIITGDYVKTRWKLEEEQKNTECYVRRENQYIQKIMELEAELAKLRESARQPSPSEDSL